MGVLIVGFFIPLVRSGKLRQLLQAAELGRTESNRQTNLGKVCEINVSVSNDYERARIFPKRYVAHMLLVLDALGFSDAEFRALHIDPEAVKKIKAAFTAGGSIEEVAPMITDAMVDAGFIAGSPRDCIERLQEMCSYAQVYDFDQICLAKLGPDYKEAITILAEEILPSIVQWRGVR